MAKVRKAKHQRAAALSATSNVAGIDIGSTEHWVCVPAGEGEVEVRSFGTTTTQLEALADLLTERRVRSVAMESTSVYWIPLSTGIGLAGEIGLALAELFRRLGLHNTYNETMGRVGPACVDEPLVPLGTAGMRG